MDDLARIQSALNSTPPEVDRATWVKVGMAIKSELGDAGFDLFDRWSKEAASYKAADCRDTWKSIKPSGGVSIGSLFRLAKEHGWQPEGEYQPPKPEELEQRRQRQQAEQKKAEAEARRKAAKAAKRASAVLDNARPASHDHTYLLKKGVRPHGLRLFEGDLTLAGCDCNGALIVPIRDIAGKLHSLEFITATGEKRFLPDGARSGHFHLIGNRDNPYKTIAIAEGYATAATVWETVAWATACAFSSHNLLPVARAIRRQYPDLRIVIIADSDHKTPGNPGVTAAKAAANVVGAGLFVPDFSSIETDKAAEATDANDLCRLAGSSELARQLDEALAACPAPEPASNKNMDNTIHQDSKKPSSNNEDRFADQQTGPYALKNHTVYFLKGTREGETVYIPIANFAALITEEIHRDDGLEDEAAFIVEGRLNSGHKLPAVEIPARSFAGMAWVPAHWGAAAIVFAGQNTKDHLRAAIQMLSGSIPRRTVYAHSGCRKIEGKWHYLHANGGITADGPQIGIEVDMGKGHMSRYSLPAPLLAGKLQVAAVRKLLSLLDISKSNPALGAALLAAVCRAPLGEAFRIDHGIFLAGTTGAQKSECAALALACFGQFDARSFPANWSDSESDLEAKAHTAKDAVWVCDDFKPCGSMADVQRLHSKADRLFRGVGNQSGRGRRGPDMKGRAAYFARGMVVATGEDVPKGVSLRARLLIIELARGDVDLPILSELQQAAASGELAGAMATFLQWLAPRMDDLKATIPQKIRELRDKTLADGWATSHPRAAEMHASLFIGAAMYVYRFAVEIGALTTDEANAILDRYSKALRQALERQNDFVKESDEVERFFALIRAALTSGRCHLPDSLNQGPPDIRPHGWGYRGSPDKPDDKGLMRAMGDCVGWVNSKTGQAWLNPDAAFATVQNLAREQGDTFTTTPSSLWRMFQEKGLLAAVEPSKAGKPRTTVKRTIGGTEKRCLVLPAHLIESCE